MATFKDQFLQNHPDLWRKILPRKALDGHKYHSGHARIFGAPALTGATRLAAEACARIGAGLVTVLATPETASIYKESLPAHIMVREDLKWDDSRVTANLWGPGGVPAKADTVSTLPTVLDAEALSGLPARLMPHFVLTPHEGEFARAFPGLTGTNSQKAQTASKGVNAIIVLKGADTVIAAPDGQIVVNDHASPELATAGTGDVLAGMITGLLAQGMAPFEAACAAVWIHGECARKFGRGLVASDIPGFIPGVLKELD